MSQATKRADTAVITPFEYTAFLWAIILAYVFLGEIPNKTIIFGGILIVMSGIYIIYREKNNYLGKQKL